jgi:elongation factor G
MRAEATEEDTSRMAATEPTKIRNIVVTGHRGVGKTSLVEALLFQAEKTNRLGTVEQGTTVSDWDEHEQRRAMSLSGSLCHLEWKDRKINLVDTPGDAGFQADTYAALRVVEGVVVVLSGVMGVEVNTSRVWQRAEEQELSRVVFVNMLDRERADFFRVLEAARQQLSDRCVAIELPIGAEHELTGIVDLLHMCAYMDPAGGRESGPQPIPDSMTELVAEYREKLLDAVVETDEDLMARYLEGEELDVEAVAHALKQAVTRDELYPVACGVASKNLGTTALLDLLVEGVPSPAKKGTTIEFGDAKQAVFVFKTIADPFTGRISCFRVLAGPVSGDTTLVDPRTHAKERLGQVLLLQGKDSEAVEALGIGDLGAVAKLKDVVTGDVLVDHEVAVEPPHIDFPEPVMSFAVTPKAKGDEEKMATGLRRLHEEDPTLIMRRDPQTGEQLLSGLSQMQVEVAVDRLRRARGTATRSRPVDAASSATARSCSSRCRPRTASWATSSSTRSSAASSRRATGRPSTRASARRWSTASSPARPCRASASCSSTAWSTTSTPRRWHSRSRGRWRSRRRTSRLIRCCSSRSWSSR